MNQLSIFIISSTNLLVLCSDNYPKAEYRDPNPTEEPIGPWSITFFVLFIIVIIIMVCSYFRVCGKIKGAYYEDNLRQRQVRQREEAALPPLIGGHHYPINKTKTVPKQTVSQHPMNQSLPPEQQNVGKSSTQTTNTDPNVRQQANSGQTVNNSPAFVSKPLST